MSDKEHKAARFAATDDQETPKLDSKEVLIVKDGKIQLAHPQKEPEPQFDANGERIKASGTWSESEHERFLKAIAEYPKGPWKAIAAMVGSRTVRQTQTHAQKYREKMARRIRGLRNRDGSLQTPPLRVITPSRRVYGHVFVPIAVYDLPANGFGPGMSYVPMMTTTSPTSPSQVMISATPGPDPTLYYSTTPAYSHPGYISTHPSTLSMPPSQAPKQAECTIVPLDPRPDAWNQISLTTQPTGPPTDLLEATDLLLTYGASGTSHIVL
ncbi:hypothetical protein Poli38472_008199 [Pythium oligandrum]|uniref:Uncharacterized protein n=1 Tax=Pythium oligandrum TaxID=41045 RepID=A0A8K1CLA1_PYTOL|nr:hypothetical protein Poli38472_008199 [Pythium oligandrum]|eukprot:TMW65557.1 hypothetical protein Poli38472_008199 [Pythium oligandrum]